MEEKAVLIMEALKESARVQFTRLLMGFRERSHGVMTFLAGLELTRRRVLVLRQAKPFAELWLYRREDEEGETLRIATEDEAGVNGEQEPEPETAAAVRNADEGVEA
jgi:chromatin segregation and condensation protein Rec8/ScpA/Scc1 (kleisin family)